MKNGTIKDYAYFGDIPSYSDWRVIEQVNKGWSRDEKYYIETRDKKELLLRISNMDTYDSKNLEFESMKKAYKLGIIMSEPIDLGICGDGKYVYSLLSWIGGEPADEVISSFSGEAQYNLGIKAGKILKLFHSISAPKEQEDWEHRMKLKLERHIQRYKDCGIKVVNEEYALKYIHDNLHLLKNRPQVYQHGDFHLGNLIITDKNEIGVIDFNRWDYGDPFEEFYKTMIFSRELSIPFTHGQINGYFGNDIPDNFFPTVSLYLADVILFSVAWAMPFGKDEVDGMVKRAEMILDDFDNFNTSIPKWLKIWLRRTI